MVVRFCEYHAEEHGADEMRAWDDAFINVDTETLIDVIQVSVYHSIFTIRVLSNPIQLSQASLYLDIAGLHALGCKQLARIIRSHDEDSIRSIFGITAAGPDRAALMVERGWRYVA